MAQNFFLTGCASGMGRHLADVIQRRGDCVFATDRDGAALAEAARSLGWPADRVRTRALDVTKPEDYEAAFAEAVEAFGHVDVLMNIAGLLLCAWVGETPLREVDAQIDVNVKGVIHGTQLAARHMVPRGSGHIINIASVAGLVAAPGLSVYCASKFACRAYSIAAAHELRPKGVYVTAICPATVVCPGASAPTVAPSSTRRGRRTGCGDSLGMDARYIAPGAPLQNGYAESVHSWMRDEFLGMNHFHNVLEARALAVNWKENHNTMRMHKFPWIPNPSPSRATLWGSRTHPVDHRISHWDWNTSLGP